MLPIITAFQHIQSSTQHSKWNREKYTDWLAKYKMSLFADVTVICEELKEHISKLAGQKINTQSVTPIYY